MTASTTSTASTASTTSTASTAAAHAPSGAVKQLALFEIGFGVLLLLIAVGLYATLGREGGAEGTAAFVLGGAGLLNLAGGLALAARRARPAVTACVVIATATFVGGLVGFVMLAFSADSPRIGKALATVMFIGAAIAGIVRAGKQARRELDEQRSGPREA